jgi:hypothetical protein
MSHYCFITFKQAAGPHSMAQRMRSVGRDQRVMGGWQLECLPDIHYDEKSHRLMES